MKAAIGLFCVVACASAVQVGLAPATSYIYRSDNDGPASYIEVGSHGYQQPQLYTAPLSVVPHKALESYDLAPVPLPYVAAKPIIVEDAEEDDNDDDDDSDSDEGSYQSGEGDLVGHGIGYGGGHGVGHEAGGGSSYGQQHHAAHEAGGGSSYGQQHHAAHGEKGNKGYHSVDHHAKGAAGKYGKEHDEGYYHEAKGEKGAHHDEADAHGSHFEAGKGYKGGDHGHKKHHSKGEDVTGYHKVFHKDEFKKDHDFYDVAGNSGNFKKHGFQAAHHGSEEGAHKKGEHGDAGFQKGGFGKSGFHKKGHLDEAEEGHSAEEGADSHYAHEGDYGKKGGSSDEKEYAFGDGGYGDDKHDDE